MKNLCLYFFSILFLTVFQFKAIGKNYYELFGISPDASQKEIKKGFKRYMQKWHPDMNDDPKAHDMFIMARKIYDTLSDPQRRKKYNSSVNESWNTENANTGDTNNMNTEDTNNTNTEDMKNTNTEDTNKANVNTENVDIADFLAKYPNPQIRAQKVSQFTDLESLRIIMTDTYFKVRQAVVEQASKIPEGVEIIEHLSKDPKVDVRVSVVQSIGTYLQNEEIKGYQAVVVISINSIIDTLMKDPSYRVREAVAGLKPPDALRFRILMRDPYAEVRRAVATEAGRMEDNKEEAIEILNILKNDSNPEAKKGVIIGAILLGDPIVEEFLDHFMQDPDPSVRGYVASSIIGSFGAIRVPSAVERLKVLMRDFDPQVRQAVAESAGRMYGNKESAIEILNILKTDPNPKVKRGVVKGAMTLSHPMAEKILDHFMQDMDPNIRKYIADNIIGPVGSLRGLSAVERLNVLMRDTNPKVRKAVARSAGRMKVEKHEARKILYTLSRDTDSKVVDETFRAASSLEGKRGLNFIFRGLNREKPANFNTGFEENTSPLNLLTGDSNNRERLKWPGAFNRWVFRGLNREKPANSNTVFEKNTSQLDPQAMVEEAIKSEGQKAESQLDILMKDPNTKEHIAENIIGDSGELRVPSAVKRLEVLGRNPDPAVRRAVARSAGRMKNKKEAIKILNILKNDFDPEVKKSVIAGVLEWGDPIAEEFLDHFMQDPDPSIREHIAENIIGDSGELRVPSAVKRLQVLVKDSASQVREKVAESAGGMEDNKEEAIEILNILKTDPDPKVKRGVIIGAMLLEDPIAEEVLDHFMQDPDPDVRKYIARNTIRFDGELRVPSAVKRLRVLMRDPDPRVRKEVAESAGRMDVEKHEAIEILNILKTDSDPEVKEGVIEGVSGLGDPIAEEFLDHFMQDPDPDIRKYIARNTIRFDGELRVPSAVKRLKVLVVDPDPEVRQEVARSAGKMYGNKESAIEILIALGKTHELSIISELVQSALRLGREETLIILTSILLENKNVQVQEYIGRAVRENFGEETYQRMSRDGSCARSLTNAN